MEREQGHRRGSSLCYVNPQEVSPRGFRSVVFNHGPLCSSGDIWPGPGTFFIVMAGEVGCAIDIWWVEAKMLLNILPHVGQPPYKELSSPKCE